MLLFAAMCDDKTESDAEIWLEKRALSRREFALVGASVAIAAVPGCAAEPGQPSSAPVGATSGPTPSAKGGAEVTSRTVTIDTPEGKTDGFFVAPASGKHPGVLMWPQGSCTRDLISRRADGPSCPGAGCPIPGIEQLADCVCDATLPGPACSPRQRSTVIPICSAGLRWRQRAISSFTIVFIC